VILPPGATSISVDVFFADDTGAAVTGKVAADFPVCKWSSGTNTADTTITLSDLAAITTAHPNDNTAGGVKEREGGWYRLDLPNNMLSSAGRKTLTFAETTNKRIMAPIIEVQYVQSDLRQAVGQTQTLDANNALNVSTKYVGGTLQTARDLGNALPTVNPGAGGGLLIAGSNAGTTIFAGLQVSGNTVLTGTVSFGVTTFNSFTITNALSINGTSNVAQTGDSYTRLGAAGAGLTALGDTRIAHLDADVTSRLAPTVAGRTLDVAATGEAGLDFDNVHDASGAHTLTNIRVPNVTLADTVTTYTGNTPQTGDNYARLGAPAGASVSADIAAVAAKTTNIPASPAAVADIPTANANADALLDRTAGVETGLTLRQAMRLMAAVLFGKSSNGGGTYRDTNDTKARITATLDTDGNRTAITRDAS
jgi:hypothetical protein